MWVCWFSKTSRIGRVFSCFLFLEEMGGKGGAVLGGGVFNASFMLVVSWLELFQEMGGKGVRLSSVKSFLFVKTYSTLL